MRLFWRTSPDKAAAEDLTAPWLSDTADATAELGVDYDPASYAWECAVVRGLLIEVLATGEIGPATESLERFITMLERSGTDSGDGENQRADGVSTRRP